MIFIFVITVIGFIIFILYAQKEAQKQVIEKQAEVDAKNAEDIRQKFLENKIKNFNELLRGITEIPITIAKTPAKNLDISEMPEIKPIYFRRNMMYENFANYVVIDVETTGLSPTKNKLLEISAIRFDNYRPIEHMTTLINPKSPITEKITKINGITNGMVKNAPTINEVAKAFEEFIGKERIVVGHNIVFDLEFLYVNNINLLNTKRKYIDTVTLASKTLKRYDHRKAERNDDYYDWDVDDYKLNTLLKYYNIYTPQNHRALNDAIATGCMFKEILQDFLD